MLFNSLQFCLFFVIVTVAYYMLPWRSRWKMLLVASCAFYMAFVPVYILILAVTILIDYFMGLKIAASTGRARKVYLVISIISTCLVLFVFKYYNFFALTVRQLQTWFGASAAMPLATIILPIGLSFHTFQSLSYVIEVYRGAQKPERNFGIYALYVMFYPQLVAGPIERPQNLLHQFYEDHRFDIDNISRGLVMIAWGFFKKMVVADRCASYVNTVYGSWDSQSGLSLVLGTLLFAIQIYADFSGYSSIAIGCARVMGFKLMTNFNHPYFAKSVSEFWKRWHISLSTWFKDYVYIPLGGNRTGLSRHYLNLLITFTVSGLWHGANWTFVIWGAYNGVLLVVESMAGKWWFHGGRAWQWVRRIVTLFVVNLAWVFFRASDLRAALGILQRMFTQTHINLASIQAAVLQTTGDNTAAGVLFTTLLFVALMFILEVAEEQKVHVRFMQSPAFQGAAVVAMFQAVMLFGVLRASSFIYFQF